MRLGPGQKRCRSRSYMHAQAQAALAQPAESGTSASGRSPSVNDIGPPMTSPWAGLRAPQAFRQQTVDTDLAAGRRSYTAIRGDAGERVGIQPIELPFV